MFRTLVATTLAAGACAAVVQAQDPAARPYIVIGCVSQENAKAPFLITDTRRTPPAVYRLDGDVKQLAVLVGQTIEVSGPITAPPGAQPPVVKVVTLARISTTCLKAK
jgi:hypothetical protein